MQNLRLVFLAISVKKILTALIRGDSRAKKSVAIISLYAKPAVGIFSDQR